MAGYIDYTIKSLASFYTETAIPNAPKHGGKLTLSDAEAKASVPRASLFSSDEPGEIPTRIAERIHYRHEETPLNTVFFSQSNIRQLQDGIRLMVLQMSGTKRYSIEPQSEQDLLLIMRSYYLQYATNDPTQTALELITLNNRVIAYASNAIMVEIGMYLAYRKDILDFPAPIERPVLANIYGTRTGELKSFF
jgi:hypothetical protein